MESDNIDKKIGGLIKDSEMYYAPEANQAYGRVWNALDISDHKPVVHWPYWMAAAAVVLLLMFSSIFIVQINNKETELISIKQEVQQLHFLAEKKNQDLQNSQLHINELISLNLENESKINLLANTDYDKETVIRDTIYITRTEIVKVVEKSIALHQPEIMYIPKPLEIPVELFEDKEIIKQQFVFAEKDQEKPKNDKKKFLKFRLGNGGGATEGYSQTSPLAIVKNLN